MSAANRSVSILGVTGSIGRSTIDVIEQMRAQGAVVPVEAITAGRNVAALIDAYDSAGIDLEQPKEKLLRIAARIHHTDELPDIGTDLIKHCIYWCAKEALIKVYGKKDLTLAENLKISPFSRKMEGDIIGKIIAHNEERIIPLHYMVFANFVVVYTKRTDL